MKREFSKAVSIIVFVTPKTAIHFWSVITIAIQFQNLTNASMPPLKNDTIPKVSAVSSQLFFDRDRAYKVARTMDFEIELTISIVNLTGTFRKYNLLCHVLICQYNDDPLCIEHQRTETIKHEAKPKFATKIMIPYSPSQEQKDLLFAVGRESSLRDEFINLGQTQSTMGKLLRNGITELPLKIKKGDHKFEDTGARIIIHAEKLTNNYDEIVFTLAGVNLTNSRLFGLPDTYVEVYKHSATTRDEYVLVHRTETYKNSVNPVWNPIDIPVRSLCNGEYDRSLKFVVLDWSIFGSSNGKCLGEFNTSFNGLSNDDAQKGNGQEEKIFSLVQPDNNVDQSSGRIRVFDLDVTRVPSFASLVKDGLKLHGTIAIDFTTMNGEYKKFNSLHHLYPDGELNQYEKALKSVVNAMEIFGDKKFSLFGFGAQLKSHADDLIFNMNPNGSSELVGIEEIMKAYRHTVETALFYWPSEVETVIEKFVEIVDDSSNPNDYFVLFLLTCSGVHNVANVEEIIRNASKSPLSIVFVGIGGNARKFESLRALDADNVRHSLHRDAVQFVQFNTFNPSYDSNATKSYFESELLLEIPNQVVTYMRLHGLKRRSSTDSVTPAPP